MDVYVAIWTTYAIMETGPCHPKTSKELNRTPRLICIIKLLSIIIKYKNSITSPSLVRSVPVPLYYNFRAGTRPEVNWHSMHVPQRRQFKITNTEQAAFPMNPHLKAVI